ncbi:MAG: transposase [Ilumatobacter sp.]
MSRKLRPDPAGGWHHVMNRGVNRQRIFFDDADRIEFGRCLALACRRFGVELHAYCLMDNHFHLLFRCPDGHLSDVMHLACGLYARSVNLRHARVGHLFGDRFCSREITSFDYVANAMRYIHRNPLDIDGIDDPAQYRWSSYPIYLGLRSPADFIRIDVISDWFAQPSDIASFVTNGQAAVADGLAGVSTTDVLGAVELVIDERSTLAGREVLTQRRAVVVRLARAAGSDMETRLLDQITPSGAAARRAALWRAEQHLTHNPATSDLVAPVLDLVRRRIPIARTA